MPVVLAASPLGLSGFVRRLPVSVAIRRVCIPEGAVRYSQVFNQVIGETYFSFSFFEATMRSRGPDSNAITIGS